MLLAAIDTENGLWQRLVNFLADFDQSFPGLADQVAEARDTYFLPMAFVLLVYKLVKEAGTSSAGGQMKSILRAAVLVAVIALAPKLINVMSEGFESLAEEMGSDGSPKTLIGELEDFAAESAALATGATAAGEAEEEDGGFFDAINPSVMFDRAAAAVQQLVLQFAVWVLTIVFKLAIFLALGLGLLRFVIVQFSALFLPVFVAFVGIPTLSGNGVRYVLGLIGVLAWPLAWGVSNVGTEALFEAITVNATTGSLWEILWALALALFLPLYVIVTYTVGPIFLQRMVAYGSNAAASMIGSALSPAMRLAGAAGAGALSATATQATRGANALSRPKSSNASMPPSRGGSSTSTAPTPSASSATVSAGDLAQRYAGGNAPSPSAASSASETPSTSSKSSSNAGGRVAAGAKRVGAAALRGLANASAVGAEAAEAGSDYAASATEALADPALPTPNVPIKRAPKAPRGLLASLSAQRQVQTQPMSTSHA